MVKWARAPGKYLLLAYSLKKFDFVLKPIEQLEYCHDSPVWESCDGCIKYLVCGRSWIIYYSKGWQAAPTPVPRVRTSVYSMYNSGRKYRNIKIKKQLKSNFSFNSRNGPKCPLSPPLRQWWLTIPLKKKKNKDHCVTKVTTKLWGLILTVPPNILGNAV